ncbi:MAG: hypothetical protein ACYCST_00510 [Acidimicrobiales bacterium]
MRRLLQRVTRDLVRRGVRDGLLGGNGVWLAVGAAAWLVRFLARTPEQRVVRERIRVGETITVTSTPAPPFGRRARTLERADRAKARRTRREVRAERKRAPVTLAGGTAGGDG